MCDFVLYMHFCCLKCGHRTYLREGVLVERLGLQGLSDGRAQAPEMASQGAKAAEAERRLDA